MQNFNHKRRSYFSGPHLAGPILIAAGIFALISPTFLESYSSLLKTSLVGTGAICLGIIVVSTYGGTLINFTKKSIKEYFSICGFKFGEWEPITNISLVKVISASHISTNTSNGISPTLSGKVTDFKILVYSNSETPVCSFNYSKKGKAVQNAKILAANFQSDLEVNLPD